MAISSEEVLAVVKKNPVVTSCVAVSLIILGAMYFRGGDEDTASVELEENSRKGQRMANNIKFAARLDEQLAAITSDRETIESRLVDEGQLAENLQYFYELEAATETKLVDLRQMSDNSRVPTRGKPKPAGKSAFKPVSYAVALVGSYPQIVSFLRQLESGEHFCRVLSASFVPAAGTGDQGTGPEVGRPEMLTLTLSLELLGRP